jgi:hypothetical protein
LTFDKATRDSRTEQNQLGRRGENVPRSVQSTRSRTHCGGEIPVHLRQCSNDKVAYRVTGQRSAVKTVLKDIGELDVTRERDETITDVARRGDPKLSGKAAGRTTVVRYGHNCTDGVRVKTRRAQGCSKSVPTAQTHKFHGITGAL